MQLRLRMLVFSLLVVLFGTSAFAAAGGNSGSKRNVDDKDTVRVRGNVHASARPENDRGPTNVNLKYQSMVLVLAPRADAKDRPDQYLAQLHNPKSPLYHQWLTPAQYG